MTIDELADHLGLTDCRFANDCRSRAHDPVLAALPLLGGVDQLCDNTDVLSNPAATKRLRSFYAGASTPQ